MIIQRQLPSLQRQRMQTLNCLVSIGSAIELQCHEESLCKMILINVARVLKHLAAMGTIYEVDADKYLPTPLSKSLAIPMYSDGILYSYVSTS